MLFSGGGGGGGGGGHSGGVPDPRYVFRRRRGLFLRPPHVRDFVKEGYFCVPTYEVWGSESPYNPLNFKITLAENKEKSAGKIIIGTYSIKINFFSISLVMSGKL